jgi:hypothetical protein
VARNLALASTAVVLSLLAGCGFDEGRDLRPVVEQTMPAHARLLAPCSHTDGLIDYAAYSCTALVEGAGARTTQAIATALEKAGFKVACPSAGSLVAIRRDIRVTGDGNAVGLTARILHHRR